MIMETSRSRKNDVMLSDTTFGLSAMRVMPEYCPDVMAGETLAFVSTEGVAAIFLPGPQDRNRSQMGDSHVHRTN